MSLMSRHLCIELPPKATSIALSPSALLGSTLLGSPFTKYEKKGSLFHLKKAQIGLFHMLLSLKTKKNEETKYDSIPQQQKG